MILQSFEFRSFEAREYRSGETTHFNMKIEHDDGDADTVYNPFLDWVEFNKSFPEKLKVIVTKLKDCVDDLISKRSDVDDLAQTDFYPSISSSCATCLRTIHEHDENDFKEGGYEIFSFMTSQAHYFNELRYKQQRFSNHEDYAAVMVIVYALDDLMNKFEQDYDSHHIWIFMNYYRSYNPFFYRNSAGDYVVRDFELFDECFIARSVALYFMVCRSMLVNILTNILLYVS